MNTRIHDYFVTTLITILLLSFNYTIAQDEDEFERFPVMETFRHTQVINAQTIEMLAPGRTYEFKIQHRFGNIGDEPLYNFFGIDFGAKIRLSLTLPLTERFYIGFGRILGSQAPKKIWDIETKYLLLKQTEENEIPVSIAVYSNIAIKTKKFQYDSFYSNSDSTATSKFKFSHRVYYNTQIIIARKFTERISFQVTPVFIWKNLRDAGKENLSIAFPVSGKFLFKNNSSIIFEYAYVLNKENSFDNTKDPLRDPLSIGLEIATSGHVFQLVFSSTQNIIEQEIYTNNPHDYLMGNFHFGFNIKRNLFY